MKPSIDQANKPASSNNTEFFRSNPSSEDENTIIHDKDKSIPESNFPIQTTSLILSETDLDKICQINEIAWKNYFSKPLPEYKEMQIYWKGELHRFHELKRQEQIEIIKSAHVSRTTTEELEEQQKSSDLEFQIFMSKIVSFHPGFYLACHGIGHSVRTAIISYMCSNEYFRNFKEFQNFSPRILLCCLSASLLHDIGRCLGGDGSDIFGETSAFIAGEILSEIGCFSDDEIEWIKEAIVIGGIDEKKAKIFLNENGNVLNEKYIIACIMGDSDSFEFERFKRCDINYTSVKKLGILTNDGKVPDDILNSLKSLDRQINKRIQEPKKWKKSGLKSDQMCNYTEILREELLKLTVNM